MMGAYNRDVSMRKARRKRRIANSIYSFGIKDYYNNLHQYSKNKIHCSCPDCAGRKTRNKGSKRLLKGNYQRSIHYKACDLRKVLFMDESLRELGLKVPHRQFSKFC